MNQNSFDRKMQEKVVIPFKKWALFYICLIKETTIVMTKSNNQSIYKALSELTFQMGVGISHLEDLTFQNWWIPINLSACKNTNFL